MSCCVCRLPFLPHHQRAPNAIPAHKPPPGVFNTGQLAYFERAFCFGEWVYAFWMDLIWTSNNLFTVDKINKAMPIVMSIAYEPPSSDETCIVMHHTCMNIFRHVFEVEENTRENLWMLAAVEHAMGRPQGRANAGRWRDVDYESIGECVDTRALWTPGRSEGLNVFDWKGLEGRGYDWLVNRPDIFPRFYLEVSESRMRGLSDSACGTDILTRQPTDVLRAIAVHLDARGLAQLSGTCRYLRFLALTDWQPVARSAVRRLGWAIPTAGELREAGPSASVLTQLVDAQQAGDWMLYLSHVNRTKSMRVRRWIWALCIEIRRIANTKITACGVLEAGSPAWTKVEAAFETKWELAKIYHGFMDMPAPSSQEKTQEQLEEDLFALHERLGVKIETQYVRPPPIRISTVSEFRRDLAAISASDVV